MSLRPYADRVQPPFVVTGYARLVTDPADLARCRALVRPWVDQPLDRAIRIRPDLVTGVRLTGGDRAGEV